MDSKESVPSTSQPSEGTSGKWSTRNKRLQKKKISMAYLLKIICSSQESCIDWLRNKSLIPKIMFCPNCSKKMEFEVQETAIDNYIWICKECKINPPSYSARHGSWLEEINAPLVDILLFIYLWVNGFNEIQIAKETNLPMETVRNWDKTYINMCASRLEDEDGDEDYNCKTSSKDAPIIAWRKKNKFKDPFLEFLKDADSL